MPGEQQLYGCAVICSNSLIIGALALLTAIYGAVFVVRTDSAAAIGANWHSHAVAHCIATLLMAARH